jgi:hypothetical protein
MKRTNLLLVCGLAAAISAPAMAQTGNQPGQRPGERPGQQRDPTRDRDQDRLGQQGEQDASSILRQLEGSWHIEIRMDPKLFGHATLGADRPGVTPGLERPGGGQDRDLDPTRDQDDPLRRDPADPAQRDQDDPLRDPGQPAQPGQPDRVLGADQDLVTSRGYSQNRLILNDKVLHEAAVIVSSGDEAGAGARPSGSEQIQALTFLGFDDQSSQYSFVIMSDRTGKINCNHGNYDASSKRITFEKEGMMGMRTGQSRMGQDAGELTLENVKIVLEIVSNDEHKVTMYDTGASTRATPGLRDREDREQDRAPGVDAGTRQQDRPQPGQDVQGKIVYEATYTRADGDAPGAGQQPGQMPGQERPGRQPGGGQ